MRQEKHGGDVSNQTTANHDEQVMRTVYAKTSLARMGIPYERAIERRSVRAFLESVVKARRDGRMAA